MNAKSPTVEELGALPAIPGGWCLEMVSVGDSGFELIRPVSADSLLEAPDSFGEDTTDDYVPYWSYLWPAAHDMARVVIDQEWPENLQTLEIGSGIGLVGIAGMAAGLVVTMSDYRNEAVELARLNGLRNGFSACRTRRIDWTESPSGKWDLILACDVLYEENDHDHLIRFLSSALRPNAECWIGDPGRQRAIEFFHRVDATGTLRIERIDTAGSPIMSQPNGQFHVLRIRRSS